MSPGSHFVAVHVGAGSHAPRKEQQYYDALANSCRAASRALTKHETSLAATCLAIMQLEASPCTNAGLGSNLNMDGKVEADASIAAGSGAFGAIGAASGIHQPIETAYHLALESTWPLSCGRVRPMLLVGPGAYQYATSHGLAIAADVEELKQFHVTEGAHKAWLNYRGMLLAGEAEEVCMMAQRIEGQGPPTDTDSTQAKADAAIFTRAATSAADPSARESAAEPAIPASCRGSPASHQPPYIAARDSWPAAMMPKNKRPRVTCTPDTPSVCLQPPAPYNPAPATLVGLPATVVRCSNEPAGLNRALHAKQLLHGETCPAVEVCAQTNGTSVQEGKLQRPAGATVHEAVHKALQSAAPAISHPSGPQAAGLQPPAMPAIPSSAAATPDTVLPQHHMAMQVLPELLYDTVGALAVDVSGRVAAGVSSGGLALKYPGRVGEAALYGCGCWAQDPAPGRPGVAISVTGVGEAIMRCSLARQCAQQLVERPGDPVDTVLANVIAQCMEAQPQPNECGVLAARVTVEHGQVDVEFSAVHTTPSMGAAHFSHADRQPNCTMLRQASTTSVWPLSSSSVAAAAGGSELGRLVLQGQSASQSAVTIPQTSFLGTHVTWQMSQDKPCI